MVKKWVELEYEIGDIVYLKTDERQLPRIVVGISLRNCGISYALAQGTIEVYHFDIEISREVNVLMKSE